MYFTCISFIHCTTSDEKGPFLCKIDCCCMNVHSQLGGFSYVGCFADNSSDRDLPISTAGLEGGDCQASLIDCAGQCAGYEYMGLQWTSQCFCGNSYGSLGSAECPDDCGLSGSTDCGNRNAIYSGTFFLPPAAPFGPPSLHCTSRACDLKTNNPGPTDTIWATLLRF